MKADNYQEPQRPHVEQQFIRFHQSPNLSKNQ
jgi:hypothetical protein